ncbi:MAG: peptidoglycan DD-metalloendopeptidase family protein [Gammaproteobacteria bacterium]|nr:peptidoglycan DD-metalloendopeptidase family protein [Gammaproteobacteria bacterium]
MIKTGQTSLTSILASVALILAVTMLSLTVSGADNQSPANKEEIQQKIDALMKEIREYQATIQNSMAEKKELEKALEENEKKISDLQKRIEGIEKDIDKTQEKVGSLETRRDELQSSVNAQHNLIGQHVQAAYVLGKQEYLKILLNQEDPDQVARMLTYYEYITRERSQKIDRFLETISELEGVHQSLLAEHQVLLASKASLAHQFQALAETRNERESSIARLNQYIAQTGSALEERIRNRQQLEMLLDRITASIANLSTPEESLPFSVMKGKLNLPVQGKILENYGNSRHVGKLRWNGLYIAADKGSAVHAIHYGRVVFADWLRGFGLLMIINHGEGYMSLYGHNQLLYKEPGEWVSSGDIIARAGDSGGQQRDGLYFEIRQSGKPTDPLIWCSLKGQNTA